MFDFLKGRKKEFSELNKDTCGFAPCLAQYFQNLMPSYLLMTVSPPLSFSQAVSNSRGDFLLNGEFVVSMFKREIKVGNAVIEYSGSDHVIERINCTDRIEEEIIVQVATPYLTVEKVM